MRLARLITGDSLRSAATVLAISSLLNACSRPTEKQPAQRDLTQRDTSTADERAAVARDRAWNRRRDCSNAADREMARPEWTKPVRNQIFSWTGHYNAQDDGCYVLTSAYDATVKRPGPAPRLTQMLIDVFEHAVVSNCTTEQLTDANLKFAFCDITARGTKEIHGDCSACNAFIKDKMQR